MGGTEECGRGVGGWRNVVRGVEECGGKGKLCARAFKHKKCILEKAFAAIGVWEGVRHACGRGGGLGDSAGNGTVGWHV